MLPGPAGSYLVMQLVHVLEKLQMCDENAGGFAHGLLRADGTIGPYLQGQLVIVRHIAYTRIFYGVVHTRNRRKD